MPMYANEASESWSHALRAAESYARGYHHPQVGPGHLLLGVLDTCNRVAMDFCREFRRNRFEFEGAMINTVMLGLTDDKFDNGISDEIRDICKMARQEAASLQHERYSAEHLLLALLTIPSDQPSVVRSMLSQLHIDADVARIWVAEQVGRLNFAIPEQRRYSRIYSD